MKDIILIVVVSVIISITFYFVAGTAIDKNDVVNCLKYQVWEEEYSQFEADDFMIDRCSSLGIEITSKVW